VAWSDSGLLRSLSPTALQSVQIGSQQGRSTEGSGRGNALNYTGDASLQGGVIYQFP
jgi:hypothetical protein